MGRNLILIPVVPSCLRDIPKLCLACTQGVLQYVGQLMLYKIIVFTKLGILENV